MEQMEFQIFFSKHFTMKRIILKKKNYAYSVYQKESNSQKEMQIFSRKSLG